MFKDKENVLERSRFRHHVQTIVVNKSVVITYTTYVML